jgi:hypothetical protein
MPIVLTGRRPAMAALVKICRCDVNMTIDPHGRQQIPAPETAQSCAATSSANALMGVDCRHTALSRANPHSTRGTTACHFPRLRSLKAFGRRHRSKPHRRNGPASETLNIHDTFSQGHMPVNVRFAPKADLEPWFGDSIQAGLRSAVGL